MTVLQLISSEGCYGAENMMLSLASALGRQGRHPVIALFEHRDSGHTVTAEQARRRGLPVELVACSGRWDTGVRSRIRIIANRYGVEVVHAHGYKADVYAYAAAGWQRRMTLVSTCHNWPDQRPLMRAYARLDRLVLRNFDGVAAVSEPVAGVLRSARIPAETLPNGVELDRFTSAPVLRRELPLDCDHVAGFVGRLVPGKGGKVLLEAAQRVLAVRPRTAFVFAGDGPCRVEWESIASQTGIARHVLFTGLRNDMPGVYASFDVLVLPSYDEALPMCILEAMAAGCPVIATRVGSVPRAVIPGVTGVLTEPGDAAGLADALTRLLADADLRRRLGAQAREHVLRRFSAEAMASAYLEFYERAGRRRAGARVPHLQ
jgi:glycosyltransferase involved in cell wall biosynthesis